MILADQRINHDYSARQMADTSLVYAPILKKHGYSVEDYQKSVEYYIKNPDRYARIFRYTVLNLETKLKELEKEKEIMDAIKEKKEGIQKYKPKKIFFLTGIYNKDIFFDDSLKFYVDSTGGELYFDPQLGRDTIYDGPKREIRLKIDSLAGDSKKLDSLRIDSLKLDLLRKDLSKLKLGENNKKGTIKQKKIVKTIIKQPSKKEN